MNELYRRIPLFIPIGMVLFSLGACGDPVDSPPVASSEPVVGTAPVPRPAPAAVDMTSDSTSATTGDRLTPQQQIAHSQADLANRLGLDPADISVVSSGAVTWRSGALGCPKPDMNYTQALVPGFQIILQAGQARYHYHAAAGRPPFYCPAAQTESPSPSGPAYE